MKQKNHLVHPDTIKRKIAKLKLKHVGVSSIREIKKLVDAIEEKIGVEYIRMEQGSPGVAAPEVGIRAEIEAIQTGIASEYPDVQGIPFFKNELSRFCKSFLNIDVHPEGCIPTTGTMQASFVAFMTVNRMFKEREGTLFLDPGFSLHRQQLKILGQDWHHFDVYYHRGEKLRTRLEQELQTGRICSIVYSNPNNPSWICFTEEELKIIGELANKYNVIVIEDLAYFGMDFRKDIGKPGEPPYQPTVAHYTDKYILMISGSKAFCYAGQRIGMMVISDELFHTVAPDLLRYYHTDNLGYALIYGGIYACSAGVTHSAQYGLGAILKACNDGEYDFIKAVQVYAMKASIIKKIFIKNGFTIVYDMDMDEPIADGFYFTVSYPGFTGFDLVEELLHYGISTSSLNNTGSEHPEGIRICISYVREDQFDILNERLLIFHRDHCVGN